MLRARSASSERDTLANTLWGGAPGEQVGRARPSPPGPETGGQDDAPQSGQFDRRGLQGRPHHAPTVPGTPVLPG